MPINTEDPNTYENLVLIINEFEEAAINSGTREGAMIVANSPLDQMDQALEVSSASLTGVQQRRRVLDGVVEGASFTTRIPDPVEAVEGESGLFGYRSVLTPEVEANLDLDLKQALDNLAPAKTAGGRGAGTYLDDCLGCNLRLQFDWQVKPMNLLGPIVDMVDQINVSLDRFEFQLNPFKALPQICKLLEALKGFCIQDLIMLLMSLKLLLKKYISDAVDIKLDWTVVFGPILKAIVQGILSLISNIADIMLAPLECMLTALKTLNKLERTARDLATDTKAFIDESADRVKEAGDFIRDLKDPGKPVKDTILPEGVEFNVLLKNVSWEGPLVERNTYPTAPEFAHVEARSLTAQQKLNEPDLKTVPVGFQITSDTTLDDALADASFQDATILERLIVPLQEAINFIRQTAENLMRSFRSLEALVSGSLSFQLGKIGIIVFLQDIINLVLMIINLLSQNPDIRDWCEYIEEHPEILTQSLSELYGPIEAVRERRSDGTVLALRKGPEILGEIRLCSNQRTGIEADVLRQWIADLEGTKA